MAGLSDASLRGPGLTGVYAFQPEEFHLYRQRGLNGKGWISEVHIPLTASDSLVHCCSPSPKRLLESERGGRLIWGIREGAYRSGGLIGEECLLG